MLALAAFFLLLFGKPACAQAPRAPLQRVAQATTYRTIYDDLIVETARRHGLDATMFRALVLTESNFNSRICSNKGACGLTQLMPGTAARFGVRNVFDAAQNLDGGARYLRYLLDLFGDGRLALAAYNAGEGTIFAYRNGVAVASGGRIINAARRRTSGGFPPYPETIAYVVKIEAAATRYPFPGVALPRRIFHSSVAAQPVASPASAKSAATIVETESLYFWTNR